MKLASLRL